MTSTKTSITSNQSFRMNQQVKIRGFTKKPNFNGRVGIIKGPLNTETNRYPVILKDIKQKTPFPKRKKDKNAKKSKKKLPHTYNFKIENLSAIIRKVKPQEENINTNEEDDEVDFFSSQDNVYFRPNSDEPIDLEKPCLSIVLRCGKFTNRAELYKLLICDDKFDLNNAMSNCHRYGWKFQGGERVPSTKELYYINHDDFFCTTQKLINYAASYLFGYEFRGICVISKDWVTKNKPRDYELMIDKKEIADLIMEKRNKKPKFSRNPGMNNAFKVRFG